MSETPKEAVPTLTPTEIFSCMEWATVEQRERYALVFVRALSGCGEITGTPFAPYNVDSFRVCYSLIERVPGLRERLPVLVELSPLWSGIVECWDYLEGNLRRGRHKRVAQTLYELRLKHGMQS